MQLKNVLFPFDYSDRCRQTARFVKGFVEKSGARLTILNVIEELSVRHPAGAASAWPQNERDEILASSTRFLQEYVGETFSGHAVDPICKMGDPAEEIIRLAADSQANLIMMPTRGCGRFRALLLGSVTAKVLDDATCPVWTDAHMGEGGRAIDLTVRSIVCAVDSNEESIWILRSAADLADFYSATLHLITVVPKVHIRSKASTPEWENELMESGRLQMSELRHDSCVNAEIHVKSGRISHMIRQAALELRADLIVIGRRHPQRLLGRLRTNAYAIIRDSPCPVLSF